MAAVLTTERNRLEGRAQPSRRARPPTHRDRIRGFLVVSTLTITFDQVTKIWGTGSILTEPVHNPELALGIIGGPPLLLVAAMIGALIVFGGFLIRRMNKGRIPGVTAALLIGGAVGNIIDRALIGAVRDFIPTRWVVFNVADIALVAGAIGYLVFATANGRHSFPAIRRPLPSQTGTCKTVDPKRADPRGSDLLDIGHALMVPRFRGVRDGLPTSCSRGEAKG